MAAPILRTPRSTMELIRSHTSGICRHCGARLFSAPHVTADHVTLVESHLRTRHPETQVVDPLQMRGGALEHLRLEITRPFGAWS